MLLEDLQNEASLSSRYLNDVALERLYEADDGLVGEFWHSSEERDFLNDNPDVEIIEAIEDLHLRIY